MKNNKTASGVVQSSDPSKQATPNAVYRVSKVAVTPSATVITKKVSNSNKLCTKGYSSSRESLTGGVSRKKATTPSVKLPAPGNPKLRSDSGTPLIRTISNIQSTKSGPTGRGLPSKLGHQNNTRRAMSKDRVDLAGNKEKEKENVKLSGGKNQGKGSNCASVIQLEKDKAMLQQQISELVRNAESKKAEIATLKMEINKLKDLQSDDAVVQLRQELDALQVENQTLKERLVQLGAPLESAPLSDSQKEQFLRQSLRGSLQNLAGSQSNLSDAPKSLDTEGGEGSGMPMPRHLSEWDKASSSSLSEMSVACLQDRIMQMEETHHSTNEELQATLQELTDMQDQMADLQMENERMSEEKAVLLESLCSQTEKLEECRSQIAQLKQVLFQQYENGEEGVPNASEKEKHLVDLLKKVQDANEFLLAKQEELTSALELAEKNSGGQHTDLLLLRDRVRLLESTIETMSADKRVLESQFRKSQEQLSAKQIEISQLKMQLESEQQKISEIQQDREAGATSELNNLLEETRREKEKFEEKATHLQEQLAHAQQESARYKEQLAQMQEETMVAKNNARKQVSDLEFRVEQLESEKAKIYQEMASLTDALQQSDVKCQNHMEDKRELKATVGELQKNVTDTTSQLKDVQKEMEELKKKHAFEVEEWNKFQADLLRVVRVANDFKTEAEHDVERLTVENKQLLQKISSLENDLESLKKKQSIISSAPLRTSMAFTPSEVATLSSVDNDINMAALRQFGCSKARDRGANQLSVKSLIESIENATKQVKGQGPNSSCSSSTSSLNSVASDSRSANPLLFTNNNDVFIKPPLRTDTTSILRENKANSPITRHPRNSAIDGGTYSNTTSTTNAQSYVNSGQSETDSVKPLPAHPVSILANKLNPLRRNSYGDIAEKKDPLASLIKGGGSKRNALLKWCQNKTIGYKGIDITNFSSSWNDGLAFCALLHTYLPNLVPYDELDCKDKRKNFTIAFQAAESVGIPTTLNINDLITQERPDWQSIMTYVTSIYKHFETS